MADGVQITAGSGTTIATDDIGGVQHQRVKMGIGAEGSYSDVSSTNPMPVSDAGGSLTVDGPLTDTQLRATAVPVAAASLPLPSGAATAAKQPALGTAGTPSTDVLTVQGAGSGTPLPVSGPLTDAQLRATAVPISGALTDTQLRASAVPISSVAIGAAGDTSASTDTGTFSLIALIKRMLERLTALIPSGLSTANVNSVTRLNVTLASAAQAGQALPFAANLEGGSDGTNLVPFSVNSSGRLNVNANVTDVVINGVTPLTPKYAVINASTPADNAIVAAVTGKKIRVLAVELVAGGAVTATFRKGTTAITGPHAVGANGGFVLGMNQLGWFETDANTALNLNLGSGVAVGGSLVYVEV